MHSFCAHVSRSNILHDFLLWVQSWRTIKCIDTHIQCSKVYIYVHKSECYDLFLRESTNIRSTQIMSIRNVDFRSANECAFGACACCSLVKIWLVVAGPISMSGPKNRPALFCFILCIFYDFVLPQRQRQRIRTPHIIACGLINA